MHPPAFNLIQRLSDWPDCVLELRCRCTERVVLLPGWMLMECGDRTFNVVPEALRCSKCQGKPAPVYLVAGHHRTFNHGPSPDWSVELVPSPTERLAKDR